MPKVLNSSEDEDIIQKTRSDQGKASENVLASQSVSSFSDCESTVGETTDSSLLVNHEEIALEVQELQPSRTLASCDCKEKIIIAIDRAKDECVTSFQTNSNKFTPLSVVKKVLATFLNLKSSINPKHEYALVQLNENNATWILDFTNDVQEVIELLQEITECSAEDIFNLNSLFDVIDRKVKLPIRHESIIPPSYIVRTILIYDRSYTCPEIDHTLEVDKLLLSPYFTLDIIVSHEIIDATNNCEKIFSVLQNLDNKGFAYFFSVSRDIDCLMRSMGMLLAHPLQRPPQKLATYKIVCED